jgi:hypothetical protein
MCQYWNSNKAKGMLMIISIKACQVHDNDFVFICIYAIKSIKRLYVTLNLYFDNNKWTVWVYHHCILSYIFLTSIYNVIFNWLNYSFRYDMLWLLRLYIQNLNMRYMYNILLHQAERQSERREEKETFHEIFYTFMYLLENKYW